MNTYYIGMGITGIVYAGTIRKLKDGHTTWIRKDDCTSEFYDTLLCLIDIEGKDNRLSFSDDRTVYTITLEKKAKPQEIINDTESI